MALRKGQKELVEQYRGGCCAVPAIPGGGKTHCLSLWAVEMISRGLHRPGKILIVTFMNSAANNFKQRISRQLESRGISSEKDYFVSTIHGLCLQIIKEKPDTAGINQEFEILDDVMRHQLISSSIAEWRGKNEDRFRSYIEESQLDAGKGEKILGIWQDRLYNVISTSIDDFKCRGMNPVEAIRSSSLLSEVSILKCAAEIYEIYDKKLRMGCFLDFGDMLYTAWKMLREDEELLDKYRSRYSFVCEDEAQDSNLIQSEILSLIANGNMLRVGDSNQAICGSFTNSDFKYFREFCERTETRVYNITQSSRNTRDIIDLANYFVKYVRASHPVPQCRESLLPQFIEPVSPEDERPNPETSEYGIKLRVFKSWEEEVNAVATQVNHMIKEYPGKTIAVLIPTSSKIGDFINILDARGIPFEDLNSSSGQRNRPLRKLGRAVDFLSIPFSVEKLLGMFFECFADEINATGEDTAIINEMLKKTLLSCPIEELLYPSTEDNQSVRQIEGISGSKTYALFMERLDLIKELLEYEYASYEDMIIMLSDKLGFNREERAVAQKVASDIRFLKHENPGLDLAYISDELLKPKNLFSYFAGIVRELEGYEPARGIATVCTYHKSKGMEWDIVFLMGLNYGDFPVSLNDRFMGEFWFLKPEYKNPQAFARADMQKITEGRVEEDSILKSKIETISEKARLLYVGITRAREYLFLSGFHANQGKKNENSPTRYLLELKRFIEQSAKKE